MKIKFWKDFIWILLIGFFKTGLRILPVCLLLSVLVVPGTIFAQENQEQKNEILFHSQFPEDSASVSDSGHGRVIFAPSYFENIQFSELSPELVKRFYEMRDNLNSGNLEKAFPVLREFLLLHAEKFFPERDEKHLSHFPVSGVEDGGIRQLWDSQGKMLLRYPVYVICRKILQELPQETLRKWQEFSFPYLQSALTVIFMERLDEQPENKLKILKRIRNQNPCSAVESLLLEELALNAWQAGNLKEAEYFWSLELAERLKHSAESISRPISDLAVLPEIGELTQRLEQVKQMERISSPVFSIPGWSINMTQILNPEGEIIFEDFLPEEQKGNLFGDRKRDREREEKVVPQFLAFSPDGQFLIARMGTQVAVWPKDEWVTRPKSYLVILDLSSEGSLLGIISPDSENRFLIGNPLADEQAVYVPTISIGEKMEISLDIYALPDGTLTDRRTLCFLSDFLSFDLGKYSETIFLPIRWSNDGKILIGGPESGFQLIMEK